MASQHFFVRTTYLGSREIPTMRIVPGLEVRPQHSIAYFCMRCGDIWARLLHDRALLTQCHMRPCKAHGDGRLSDPAEWFDMPTRVESDWPWDALKWEFEVSLALAGSGDDSASPGVTFTGEQRAPQ
jgi:hypothetical protein